MTLNNQHNKAGKDDFSGEETEHVDTPEEEGVVGEEEFEEELPEDAPSEDALADFTPKHSGQVTAALYDHAKAEDTFLEAQIEKSDNPPIVADWQKYRDKFITAREDYLKEMLHKHHGKEGVEPDDLMDKHLKSLDGAENNPGELSMVAGQGRVPDTINSDVTKGRTRIKSPTVRTYRFERGASANAFAQAAGKIPDVSVTDVSGNDEDEDGDWFVTIDLGERNPQLNTVTRLAQSFHGVPDKITHWGKAHRKGPGLDRFNAEEQREFKGNGTAVGANGDTSNVDPDLEDITRRYTEWKDIHERYRHPQTGRWLTRKIAQVRQSRDGKLYLLKTPQAGLRELPVNNRFRKSQVTATSESGCMDCRGRQIKEGDKVAGFNDREGNPTKEGKVVRAGTKYCKVQWDDDSVSWTTGCALTKKWFSPRQARPLPRRKQGPPMMNPTQQPNAQPAQPGGQTTQAPQQYTQQQPAAQPQQQTKAEGDEEATQDPMALMAESSEYLLALAEDDGVPEQHRDGLRYYGQALAMAAGGAGVSEEVVEETVEETPATEEEVPEEEDKSTTGAKPPQTKPSKPQPIQRPAAPAQHQGKSAGFPTAREPLPNRAPASPSVVTIKFPSAKEAYTFRNAVTTRLPELFGSIVSDEDDSVVEIEGPGVNYREIIHIASGMGGVVKSLRKSRPTTSRVTPARKKTISPAVEQKFQALASKFAQLTGVDVRNGANGEGK